MNDSRFDELTKALASSTSRRQALKALAATTAGAILSLSGLDTAFARHCRTFGAQCSSNAECCSGYCPQTTYQCGCPPGTQLCNGSCVSTSCPAGQTFSPSACMCCPNSQLCTNGTCCATGTACLNNTCCPTTQVCVNPSTGIATCCAAGYKCLTNGTCAKPCTTNADCPSSCSCLQDTDLLHSYCSGGFAGQTCSLTDTGCAYGQFCAHTIPDTCVHAC